MKWALALALMASVVLEPCHAAAAKRHAAKKAIKTHVGGRSAKKSSTRLPGTRLRGKSKGKGRRRSRAAAGPVTQSRPAPERYQQIQQALADRGYYKGQATGEWNADSADAMKRFQADQKLEPDGKINSLSLMGLGLGPKHEGSAMASAPQTVSSAPASPSN